MNNWEIAEYYSIATTKILMIADAPAVRLLDELGQQMGDR